MGYRVWSKPKLVIAQVAVTLIGCALAVGTELAGLTEWLVVAVVVAAV